jgi:excisionase family DNA binding protein
MARSHKGNIYLSDLDPLRKCLGRPGSRSAPLAHLARMEPTNATESNATVVHGTFEQAWSLKELARRLQVSCQTIYDLRSQGRGPTGFRIGRELRFRASEVEAWLARLEADDAERHRSAGRR